MKTKKETIKNPDRKALDGFVSDLRWAGKNWPLYAMMLPGFVFTLLFAYFPMFGIIISFKKINFRQGIFGSPWNGLKNFEALFKNDSVWIAIRNTLLYNITFIAVGLVLSVALAIALSLVKRKLATKVYQTVYIMPHFLSMVIVAYLVFAFLNMENGVMNNSILPGIIGDSFKKINWYATPWVWPFILFVVRMWCKTGYSAIVYIATITGIDTEMYEAAEIDGASTWKQIIHITIPSLKTVMIVMTILNLGSIFAADFGLFYNVTMNSGAIYPTTLVTNTYVYNLMMDSGAASMGMSAAASMLQSIVGFLLVVITNAIVRKIDEESSMF